MGKLYLSRDSLFPAPATEAGGTVISDRAVRGSCQDPLFLLLLNIVNTLKDDNVLEFTAFDEWRSSGPDNSGGFFFPPSFLLCRGQEHSNSVIQAKINYTIYYWFPFKFPLLLGLTSFYSTPTRINPNYRSFFSFSLASDFKHFFKHRKQVT